MARRRDRIPGVSIDAERNINQVTGDIDARLKVLERKAGRPGVVISDTAAKVGEFLNIEAPADGLTIVLPEPLPSLRNARVTLSFRNTNPVRLVCIQGTVNRQSFVINNAVGTYDAICDGQLGWNVQIGVSASGSATDAEYFVGAAHGGLTNERVAQDTSEIDVVLTTPGFVSWVVKDGSLVLTRLSAVAANTIIANATGSSASPTAVAVSDNSFLARFGGNITNLGFSTLAGAGLNYAGSGVIDVVGSTSIIVTSDQLQRAALTGDVTASQNSNATTIANNAVTNAKAADMAEATIKGRAAGAGTGDPQDLTGIQAGGIIRFGTAEIGNGTPGTYEPTLGHTTTIYRVDPGGGDVTFTGFAVSGGNTGKVFLLVRFGGADGNIVVKHNSGVTAANGVYCPHDQDYTMSTINECAIFWYTNSERWSISTGTITRNGDYGDITVTSGGNTWTIDADVVTNAKLANMAANTIKANPTASTADPQDLAISADSLPARVGGNLVSHPWSTVAGNGLTYSTGALSVGAGDGIDVASDSVSVDVSDVIDGVSIEDDGSNNARRAALTGDVTASAGSNTTAFRSFDAKSVLVNATNTSAVPDDLAASTTRHVLRVNDANTALEWDYPVKITEESEGTIEHGDFYWLTFTNGTNAIWGITDNGSGQVTLSVSVDDIPASSLADINGHSVLGNPSGSSGPPESIVSANNKQFFGRWTTTGFRDSANFAGDGIDYNTTSDAFEVDVSDFAGGGLEDDGSNNLRRQALTGEVTASAGSNTTAITRSTNFSWTGNHSFGSHFILGTQQNYTGSLPASITLNDTTNRLYVLVSGTGDIQTITPNSGTTDVGRVVVVYIVGSGTKTVKHAFSGGGVGRIQCPNNVDFTVGNRDSFVLIGDGTNGWLATSIHSSTLYSYTAGDGIDLASNVFSADVSDFAGAGLEDDGSNNLRIAAITGHTYMGNPSGSSAVPTAQNYATLAGDGLDYDLAGGLDVRVSNDNHMVLDTLSQVAFRKSRQNHFWFDDFTVFDTSLLAIDTATSSRVCETLWHFSCNQDSGVLQTIDGEANHPGIFRITPNALDNTGVHMYKGSANRSSIQPIPGADITELEIVLRLSSVTSVGFRWGFSNEPGTAGSSTTDCVQFEFDTDSDTTVHCVSREASGTVQDTDTGVAPGNGWNVYTIRLETAGTFDFYIDDVLEASHSTASPDGEDLNIGGIFFVRANVTRNFDIDYVAFTSGDLGARTS